jgi:phosphoribosylformylglycinamidine synthase
LEAHWRGQKVVDLEVAFLWGGCPIDPIPTAKPERQLAPVNIPEPRTAEEWSVAVRRVLTHYHCCDQSSAGAQFDSTVQGRTVVGPYGGKNHLMPSSIYVSAPLRGRPYGMITTIAFNPLYGDVDPAVMTKLMMIEAITKAVVAGADYREMVLCDNFYTPRVRPEVAWDLQQMVETISDFSIEIGVPFISGKDSSSGTFEAAGVKIEVPATLAVSAMGRLLDVSKVVTKDFKRAGNRVLILGQVSPRALSGSVYADTYGQRGDRLFDAYDAATIRALWDVLHALHQQGCYVSGSAIAEGGVLPRLFEAAWGAGLGVRVDLDGAAPGRRDGILFGEFVGSVLLEVPPECHVEPLLGGMPYRKLGHVTEKPRLVLAEADRILWQEDTAVLTESWSKVFREVVE